MYSTPLESQCMIAGSGILETYGYATGRTGKWVSALSLLEYSPMAMFLEPPFTALPPSQPYAPYNFRLPF